MGKRSKKRWDWTEKNTRRNRTCKFRGRKFNSSVPRWYCRTFLKRNKSAYQREITKLDVYDNQSLDDFDPIDYRHRHIGKWWW